MARSAAVGGRERQHGVGPLIEGESATYVTSESPDGAAALLQS